MYNLLASVIFAPFSHVLKPGKANKLVRNLFTVYSFLVAHTESTNHEILNQGLALFIKLILQSWTRYVETILKSMPNFSKIYMQDMECPAPSLPTLVLFTGQYCLPVLHFTSNTVENSKL